MRAPPGIFHDALVHRSFTPTRIPPSSMSLRTGDPPMAWENAQHSALNNVIRGAKAAYIGPLTVRGCDSGRAFWGYRASGRAISGSLLHHNIPQCERAPKKCAAALDPLEWPVRRPFRPCPETGEPLAHVPRRVPLRIHTEGSQLPHFATDKPFYSINNLRLDKLPSPARTAARRHSAAYKSVVSECSSNIGFLVGRVPPPGAKPARLRR